MMDEYPEDESLTAELLEEIRDILAECLETGKELLAAMADEDEEDED